MTQFRKPTRDELQAAANRSLPHIIAPNLRVLFCGINPGLYTAAIQHHFGRPGNRFWPALHASGFTPRLFSPYEETELLPLGYGITNVVNRATATAAELSEAELVAGGSALTERVQHYRPVVLAVLGVTAYRSAFGQPQAKLGLQAERIDETHLWVLPNPSGLNAHYRLEELAGLFRQLREWLGEKDLAQSG